MAEPTSVLSDVRLQFQDFFGALSLPKRITILAALGIILIGHGEYDFCGKQIIMGPFVFKC